MPPGSILCWHSVTADRLPSESPMHVPDRELITAIELLRSVADIVPLREIVERHRAGRSTRGLVSLTFDDGYAALPALIGDYIVRAHVPITVFITTVATDRAARFWWDRIDDLFGHVSSDRWRAFEDVVGVPPAYRAGQPAEYGPLRPLRQWIMATHRGRWPDELEPALAALETESNRTTAQRAMSWDEILRFGSSGLVEYGVHTISHPVLPLLDDAELVAEVSTARRQLEDHVPNALPVLAIPFGLYDARTVTLAREAGMQTSLTLDNRTLRGIGADEPPPRLSMRSGLKRWKLLARLYVPRARPAGYPALPSATT
ncbi:MAG TPA: polysaccharide deacetylase family protein [Gemmatimonadaceae bacterium]|nr:polysaccharide deacetylase family protein [Gemmatimonadaceae bacterium]